MSEERITKVETEKNPKRVAAGKKLAEYNKLKREKIHAEKDQLKTEECISNSGGGQASCVMIVLTGVAIVTGLGCLYFSSEQNKREEAKEGGITASLRCLFSKRDEREEETKRQPPPSSSSSPKKKPTNYVVSTI